MKYMLDTNICIYAIKQEPEVVLQKILKHHPSDICISSITYAELMHGVEKSQSKDKNRLAFNTFYYHLYKLLILIVTLLKSMENKSRFTITRKNYWSYGFTHC